MPVPPLRDILTTLQDDILPVAGTAALLVGVFYVLGWGVVAIISGVGGVIERFRTGYTYYQMRGAVLGRQIVALGVAAAVAVAFLAGNYTLEYLKPPQEPGWENTGRLVPWMPDGENPPGWHWLVRAGLLLLVVGLLSRWLGMVIAHYLPERHWWGANLLLWAPRLGGVIVASMWLASGRANEGLSWLQPALAGVMFAIWVALDGVACPRIDPEYEHDPTHEPLVGGSAEVTAYLALMFLAAGALLLYAHSTSMMEVALILSSAMFGIAVAAGSARTDASAAIPAGVAFLPGLLLAAKSSLPENRVPLEAFWLVALAPLVLLPFLVPFLARRRGWFVRLVRLALVLAPLITAIVLAAQHETIASQDEWQ